MDEGIHPAHCKGGRIDLLAEQPERCDVQLATSPETQSGGRKSSSISFTSETRSSRRPPMTSPRAVDAGFGKAAGNVQLIDRPDVDLQPGGLDLLEERDPSAVSFGESGVQWRDHMLSLDVLERARERMTTFGSCSFREPMSDLEAIRLL